jgi:hypothetical protein
MGFRNADRASRVIAFAATLFAASAARAYEACGPACASGDLACAAAAALCEAKLRAFELYMRQIDAGQPKYPLPPIYRDVLRAHYPSVDLEKIRIAFSDQQPPDNATTFCNDIYFNDAEYVSTLRDGGPNEKWTWLLHELTHAEQCAKGGGRANYGLRWWRELEKAASGETIDVFQTTDELVKQLQELSVKVHGAMPMEQAADANAEAVLAKLRNCCIAPDGSPVRPPIGTAGSPSPRAAGSSPAPPPAAPSPSGSGTSPRRRPPRSGARRSASRRRRCRRRGSG